MSNKLLTTDFYIINIKLLSNEREGTEAYIDIFEEIFKKKINRKIASDKKAIIRRLFKATNDVDLIYYGLMSRFTIIEGNWLDLSSGDPINFELPKNLFPNLQETEFVFVPSAHRLALVKSPSFSLYAAIKFLTRAIKAVIRPEEDFQIIIEQSSDIFERILNADAVKRLEIVISYTNADITKKAVKWMDQEMKSAQLKKLRMIATPDQKGEIELDNTLIQGALGLAQSNGTVKARIVENNKTTTIETKEHPEIIQIQHKEGNDKYNLIFETIMEKFRPK